MEDRSKMMEQASLAADAMRRGGVILYPTDTVWGIGCDACRPEAVKRVFELKRRAEAKALITLVDSDRMLERYVDEVPDVALQMIEASVDPVTIVYDRGIGLANNLLAEDGSVGIRLTRDPFCLAMIRSLRRPVVSTSANVSGQAAPGCFAEISREIIDGVDFVADWRRADSSRRKPSMVIKISSGGLFKILRK